MLDHPWLKMADDYNFKMDDLEYKKYKLKQTFQGIENDFLSGERNAAMGKTKRQADYQEYCPGARTFEGNISDLADSDSDINGGDCEDNVSLSSLEEKSSKDDATSESSSSDDLSASFTSDSKNRVDEEFNLNVSFTGGYVPNTDLTRVDKGQGNPQFSGLEIKV
jgi:hypothetical protein